MFLSNFKLKTGGFGIYSKAGSGTLLYLCCSGLRCYLSLNFCYIPVDSPLFIAERVLLMTDKNPSAKPATEAPDSGAGGATGLIYGSRCGCLPTWKMPFIFSSKASLPISLMTIPSLVSTSRRPGSPSCSKLGSFFG